MSELRPPGTAPEPSGRESAVTVDGIGQAAETNGAPGCEAETPTPARSAAPNIRVRLLEAELRAERRHATTTEERLKQVQGSLQRALEQLEERRIAVVELQTVLQATEPRLIALAQALAERDQQRAAHLREQQPASAAARGGAAVEPRPDAHLALAPQHEQLHARDAAYRALEQELAATGAAHAAELERLRSEQYGLAARLAAAEAGGLSDIEQRLRATELTLQHTLRELEEARLAPVELRAALAISEHRATTLQAQVAAGKRTAEVARTARAVIDRPAVDGTVDFLLPPFGKGGPGGICDGRDVSERAQIPLNPPLSKGEAKTHSNSSTVPDAEGGHAASANTTPTAESTFQSLQALIEEQQVTCIELQTILEATECRLASVEATLTEREHELTALRAATSTHAEAVSGNAAQPPQPDAWVRVAELETQLRTADITLAQTLEQLEERRAAATLDSQRGQPALLAARLHVLEAPPRPPPIAEPAPPAATAGADGPAGGPLTIVHIEDQPTGRDAVRAAVSRHPGTRYVCPQFPPAGEIRSATLLAINLLCRHLDPLAVIADARKWGVPEPRAFTYCSDGGRHMVLGLIEYFPFPFDPEACAARLFERPQGARRILTVSNHIELMTGLRTILTSGRCSTTVALDGRQALDLVKPVNPDTILIDLALPRGEALDVVNRLASDSATASIPIAFLWTQKLGSGIFRQYASRVLQDWHGESTPVGPALVKLLGTLQPGREPPLRHVG